jgi:hypothetical protein
MNHLLRGHYTSRRGSGAEYTYEGSWMALPQTVVWSAQVFQGGELAGTLAGRFRRTASPVTPATVVRVVEASIELQSGVSQEK